MEPTYVVPASLLNELFNAYNGLSTYQMQLAQSDPAGMRLTQAIVKLASQVAADYPPPPEETTGSNS